MKPLRKRVTSDTVFLPKPLVGFGRFPVLRPTWASNGAFWMGASTGLQLPQQPILVPLGAVKIFLSLLFYGIFAVIFTKAYWGLNHDAGISADLWRHPPAPIQAKAPTNRGTRYRTR